LALGVAICIQMYILIYMTSTQNTTDDLTLVAEASTSKGFSIGIVMEKNYRTGKPFYRVVRIHDYRFVTITIHDTEQEARRQANIEYRRQMKANRKTA
jgi:hypothetical protein